MSSSFGHYYYPDHGQQLLLSTDHLAYGTEDGQRSKTPSSMINHPRYSPGPLSTPPHSRGNSHPPEQGPEQMLYDDASGSQSDSSPTSVPTPNESTFEEMLDSEQLREFYLQDPVMATTQTQQDSLSATDSGLYSFDQGTVFGTESELSSNPPAALSQPTYTTSVSPQGQQYAASFPAQDYPYGGMVSPLFGQDYASRPTHHDPWTSQRPQQNFNIPRNSGTNVFDPETDPGFNNLYGVVNWLNTDPTQFIPLPPNDPLPPSSGEICGLPVPAAQQGQRGQHNQNGIPLRLTVPSPPPGAYPFVNQSPSTSFIGQQRLAESHISPASNPSSAWNSVGQLSPQKTQSPYQTNISPLSVPSPGGSDGLLSTYQPSDPGTTAGVPSSSSTALMIPTTKSNLSPSASASERSFNEFSPEPELQREIQQQRRRRGKGVGQKGGRIVGTHLSPGVAKAAHDMRKVVTCWHCALQRDKCGPGEICERCLKRSQRPNADCGLGCSRVKLTELAQDFLPWLMMQMHDDQHLTQFVTKHIRQWHNVEITIYMTCGQDHMPRMPVKVYEFIPNGKELLVQWQYETDPVTHKRVAVKKESPALGMVQVNRDEEKKYDKYVSDIVDGHLDAFGELCWMEDDNDFQQKLYRLMSRVEMRNEDEAKLLREVHRLLVTTFIMSHTLTIAEETKHDSLRKLHSYPGPTSYVRKFTSPRMANRQLKYFFARLQRHIFTAVLNRLQQIFKSSKGCDKWLAAFVAVLGLCMVAEEQQKTVHQVMETRARTDAGIDGQGGGGAQDGRTSSSQTYDREREVRIGQIYREKAEEACREIDARTNFVNELFRWKYNRKVNPLRDAESLDWRGEMGFEGEGGVAFVRRVAQLVRENTDFLRMRSHVSISHANQAQYTSRLVGQFLLSFWLP
ncbi:uncharacterized protein EI97DRAFT_12568 [Westerdykella ornata]|uniref:Uncharacterized protein n=1 Tax=Westerdykella ornata TaxID=318751 RepID=A0A6A6K0P0_WESOR|nr:uncharacterized protein EI97DRAFT_12568 [Westerdykella ornata]KAF2280899.1 hypothetical protein EI97DRAFT_12568 [Westerdykella ornata]